MADFAHPQAGSIGKGQNGTVLGIAVRVQDLSNARAIQNGRQAMDRLARWQRKRRLRSFQQFVVKQTKRATANVDR